MASGHVEPRKQAEHMAAPTSCNREENPCQRGAVHTWHLASFRCDAEFGRYRRHSGHGWTCRWVAPVANDPQRSLGCGRRLVLFVKTCTLELPAVRLQSANRLEALTHGRSLPFGRLHGRVGGKAARGRTSRNQDDWHF